MIIQTWKSIQITNSNVGISLLSEDGVHHTGSLLVQDSSFTNTNTAILIFPPSSDKATGTPGITLDNVVFNGVTSAIADNSGKAWLSGVNSVDTFVLGPAYFNPSKREFTFGTQTTTQRITGLTGGSASLPKVPYFERAKPQYTNVAASGFVQMKQFAKGSSEIAFPVLR